MVVDAPPAEAFTAFTAGIDAWWPREYSWSGDSLERMAMEPRAGGFLHEIGAFGMRLDWGRISVWQPPSRLAFSWQIGPDRTPTPSPSQASEVEVRFDPAPAGRTRVSVSHDGWDRHGDRGAAYREQVDAAGTWPRALASFAELAARHAEAPWAGLST